MKKILYSIITLYTLFLFTGCEQESKTYDGPWYVHFGSSKYTLPIDGKIEIPVYLTAPIQSTDITATINVASEGLAENTHFTVNKTEVTFKAGTLIDTLIISGIDQEIEKGNIIEINIASVSGDFSIDQSTESNATISVIPSFLIISGKLNATVDQEGQWSDWTLVEGGTDAKIGIWNTDHFTDWRIYLEMYGRNTVATTDGEFVYLTPLDEGVKLGPDYDGWIGDYGWSSDWTKMPLLAKDTFTEWYGKTAYVGAILYGENGKMHYAWFKVQVNNDGSAVTVIEWAYEANGKSILTGQTE